MEVALTGCCQSGTERLDSLDRLIHYEVATTATTVHNEAAARREGAGEGVKEEGTTTGWLPPTLVPSVMRGVLSCFGLLVDRSIKRVESPRSRFCLGPSAFYPNISCVFFSFITSPME